MQKIQSYSDLKAYLKTNPLRVCWYGPRSSDVSEMQDFFNLSGSISCYGKNELFPNTPFLSYETEGSRKKFSVDDLPSYFIKARVLQDFCEKNNIQAILPYDSNTELEEFCAKHDIAFYSKSDELKEWFRDKTNIDAVSKEINLPTIPGMPGVIDEFQFEPLAEEFGLPLFLHFVGGAGGSGNHIVQTKEEFEKVKDEQRGRRLNVKKYFTGRSCCVDICVTSSGVLCGPVEEMLIGAEPLNSNPTEYVASSWFENDYSPELRKKISQTCSDLGKFLQSKGFLGVFHPDFLINGDDVFLTELNMRFGGSCGAFAKIQRAIGQVPLQALNAAVFSDPNLEFDFEEINKENLKPLDYALLIFKNNFGRPIRIPKQYTSGLYHLDEQLKQTRQKDLSDLQDSEHVFITGLPESDEDTIIEEGAFICEIITRFPTSDTQSKLNADGKALAEKFFSQMVR